MGVSGLRFKGPSWVYVRMVAQRCELWRWASALGASGSGGSLR